MDWFRRHHGAPLNPRWRLIARRSAQPVAFVLAVWDLMEDNASRSLPRGTLVGWDDEAAAIALDIEPEAVTAIRQAMQGKALTGCQITDWEVEQPRREREDDSKDRVRAFRQRQRQETPLEAKKPPVTPRNARKRTEERRGEEKKEIENTPPPEGAPAAPGNNLVGWWVRREERTTGSRPPEREVSKQSKAAKTIQDERTPEQINRAIQGMPRLFKFSRGQPWDLFDLQREFQAALNAPAETGPTNGNGRNGSGRHDAGDWRYRKEGESARDDPLFADDDG
jgi:hypothetical protein